MLSGVEISDISNKRFNSLISQSLNLRSSHLCRGFPSRSILDFARNDNAIILVKIRLSVLSRLRNRQAMPLQSFSIPEYEDGEIQASRHATFVAKNPSRDAVRRHYRRAPGDRDDEDARESDESVRCAADIQRDWRARSTERRETRFWPRVRAKPTRSFVACGLDGVRSFLRLLRPPCAIFQTPAQDKSSPPHGQQTAWIIPDGLHRFWRQQDSRSSPCRDDERCRGVLSRRFPT